MARTRRWQDVDPALTAAVDHAAEQLALLLTRGYDDLPVRVSPSQLRVLLALRTSGPLNVGTVAEVLGALPSSASRLCDRLTAAGLVSRSVSATSRREVLVELTPAGHRLLDVLSSRRREELQRTLSRMTPQARAHLLEGLESFAAASDVVEAAPVGTPALAAPAAAPKRGRVRR